MKRIRGFKVLKVASGRISVVTQAGHWRLPSDMVPNQVPTETSWHRSWVQAIAAIEDVIRCGANEEVVIVSKTRLILSVFGRNAFESQFLDSNANPLWRTFRLQRPTNIDAADTPLFFNRNYRDIAWVTISGAEHDVPCKLSFVEKRVRKNPDGILGRLIARQNEIRDYFLPGWKT